MTQAKEYFPWDTLPGAEKYDADLTKAVEARAGDALDLATRVPSTPLTWREDPNERARRIWL
jgi:hypothetical protein